ncbi:unnamed protein product [Effrenium voratum]|nr:unnamed protein product [Effrenium voratum]
MPTWRHYCHHVIPVGLPTFRAWRSMPREEGFLRSAAAREQSGQGQHPLIFDRFMDASDSGLSPVSHMTLEELQAECVVRGLAQSGGLAAVRGRVRVARARERQSLKL